MRKACGNPPQQAFHMDQGWALWFSTFLCKIYYVWLKKKYFVNYADEDEISKILSTDEAVMEGFKHDSVIAIGRFHKTFWKLIHQPQWISNF